MLKNNFYFLSLFYSLFCSETGCGGLLAESDTIEKVLWIQFVNSPINTQTELLQSQWTLNIFRDMAMPFHYLYQNQLQHPMLTMHRNRGLSSIADLTDCLQDYGDIFENKHNPRCGSDIQCYCTRNF